MKFKEYSTDSKVNILANDHYVAIPYDCSNITADENGVIKEGTIIPSNDEKAEGVLLNPVYKDEDPNGAVVIHGFIKKDKLPSEPSAEAKAALNNIKFI